MFDRYILSIVAVLAVWITVTTAAFSDDKSCKNGGILGKGVHKICKCKPGFKGYDCRKRVRPCEIRPCRNGGKCSGNKDGTFTCTCSALYQGILCEQRVRPCDSGPCKNGGNCTDDGVKCFKCVCPAGFKGSDCSETVQPCEIKPCKNGGQCVNEDNGRFTCKCKPGYGGTFCDKKDGLYGSKILNGRYKDIAQLEKWLGGPKSWRLCYRATDNGWAASTFHSRCDHKHPTITVIRSGRYIFGAYSDIAFGGSPRYKATTNAFIFSLVNKDNLPPFKSSVNINKKQYALYTNPSYGPTFGCGHDIHIANSASANTGSYSNFGRGYQLPSGYSFGSTKARELLAGSYRFTPNEVETFYLY